MAQRLVVVSHVTHYWHQGVLSAYGPYSREIDIWADLFDQVVIAAPCRTQPPPGDSLPFSRTNISVAPIRATGGRKWSAKVMQLLLLPQVLIGLCRAMHGADAVHVRCPGNLGLLGVLLAPLFCRRLVAKYAGQWSGFSGEALTCRVQRALLKSCWWRGPVTVYGQWPEQPKHVIPFFTTVLDGRQVARARSAAAQKQLSAPLRILYVGRLSAQKNIDTLIAALALLRQEAIPLQCHIVGDGAHRPILEQQVAQLQLHDVVHFTGALEHDQVLDYYEQAHVLVLVSQSEGWPKAIVEAMAFGVIGIGSDRGLVPTILGDGRGFVIPPADTAALASRLRQIAAAPQEFQAVSARAAAWGQKHSLESLRTALRDLLNQWWGTQLETSPPANSPLEAARQ